MIGCDTIDEILTDPAWPVRERLFLIAANSLDLAEAATSEEEQRLLLEALTSLVENYVPFGQAKEYLRKSLELQGASPGYRERVLKGVVAMAKELPASKLNELIISYNEEGGEEVATRPYKESDSPSTASVEQQLQLLVSTKSAQYGCNPAIIQDLFLLGEKALEEALLLVNQGVPRGLVRELFRIPGEPAELRATFLALRQYLPPLPSSRIVEFVALALYSSLPQREALFFYAGRPEGEGRPCPLPASLAASVAQALRLPPGERRPASEFRVYDTAHPC